MSAGSLRRKVELLGEPTRVKGANLQLTDTENSFGFVSAEIEPVSASRRFQSMQLKFPISHKIKTRYRANWLTSKTIKLGVRVFKVQSAINVDERNRWIEFMCEEGGPGDASD